MCPRTLRQGGVSLSEPLNIPLYQNAFGCGSTHQYERGNRGKSVVAVMRDWLVSRAGGCPVAGLRPVTNAAVASGDGQFLYFRKPREPMPSDAVTSAHTLGVGAMGLSEVLNGMKNGPRGGGGSTNSSGGMSPLTMGLLAFLAYKALKGSGVLGSEAPAGQPQTPGGSKSSDPNRAAGSDWLSGLQKVIAGGGARSILSGGTRRAPEEVSTGRPGSGRGVLDRNRSQSIRGARGSRKGDRRRYA